MNNMVLNLLKRYRIDVVAVLILFMVALIPRISDLGTFLTADEKNWIGRSYEFVRAFKDFQFNDMLQTSHPGVTTMWLVGSAVTLKMMISQIPFSFRNISHFVTAAQFPIALVNALLIPIMYIFLHRLFTEISQVSSVKGQVLAFIASLFIALDPFLIGHSRVVHVDALLAGFLFLSVTSLIIWAKQGYSRRWLIVSAITAGMALLTKAPAIFIVPYFVLVVIVFEKRNIFSPSVFRERFRDFILWVLVVGLIIIFIWPALLWVPDPQGNVLVLKRDLSIAASTPHHMSEEYTLNSSFYLRTLLSRTTPITLLLGTLGVLWLLFQFSIFQPSPRLWPAGNFQFPKKYQETNDQTRKHLLLIVGYILFFIVMMTLGAKKGDRYILPVFPAIDLLAAVGLIWTIHTLLNVLRIRNDVSGNRNYELGIRRLIPNSLFLIPIVYVAWISISYHPYYIAYASPLFPDNFSQELGWGEGLEQVGKWFTQNDPQAVVASWYPDELGAYTSARVAHINAHEQGNVKYIVLYRNMFGRAPDHPANDFIDEYYKKRLPVFTAYVVGKEFAWVYKKRVYEQIVGELVPQKHVGQLIQFPADRVVGLDILVATYSGKATTGELIVDIKDAVGGELLRRIQIPIRQIEDNRWLSLPLPEDMVGYRGDVFIEVYAEGTRVNDAPTVRYTRKEDYRSSDLLITNDSVLDKEDIKQGDLAVRLRFEIDGRQVTEDDTKLIQQGQ